MRRLLAIAALASVAAALVVVFRSYEPPPPAPRVVLPTPTPKPKPAKRRPPAIKWDPVRTRTPNRWWRRYGTDDLVRILLRVTREFAAAHPKAPKILIGDLSRPHGGDFGRRFGPLGHVSHQNGLDADVYYPRRDRRERAPRTVAQVDLRLAQDLVDRFARAGAQKVSVGPSLDLKGPPGVVGPLPNHDNHLHVRLTKSV